MSIEGVRYLNVIIPPNKLFLNFPKKKTVKHVTKSYKAKLDAV